VVILCNIVVVKVLEIECIVTVSLLHEKGLYNPSAEPKPL
jgi:hypothetical protein